MLRWKSCLCFILSQQWIQLLILSSYYTAPIDTQITDGGTLLSMADEGMLFLWCCHFNFNLHRIIHCLCSFRTGSGHSNAFVLIYILVLICSVWLDMLCLCLPLFDCPVLLLILFGLKFILYNLYNVGT